MYTLSVGQLVKKLVNEKATSTHYPFEAFEVLEMGADKSHDHHNTEVKSTLRLFKGVRHPFDYCTR